MKRGIKLAGPLKITRLKGGVPQLIQLLNLLRFELPISGARVSLSLHAKSELNHHAPMTVSLITATRARIGHLAGLQA